eukprot:702161-Pleurochrysis_carterae.AAC.1
MEIRARLSSRLGMHDVHAHTLVAAQKRSYSQLYAHLLALEGTLYKAPAFAATRTYHFDTHALARQIPRR